MLVPGLNMSNETMVSSSGYVVQFVEEDKFYLPVSARLYSHFFFASNKRLFIDH